MSKSTIQFAIASAVAIPLFAFAFLGSEQGPLFAKVASAGYGEEKVTICHKGKNTMTVAAPAADAHFAHGDTPGACETDGFPAAAAKKK